jgi:SPP1 gp7 family putative phage head morphogenesis protein
VTFGFRQNRLGRSLDRYRDRAGTRARRAIVEELTRGMKRGDGPDAVARRIRKRVADVALGRAMTIARTEMMTALWERTRTDFTRDPVVTGWQWMARLDGRTCVICRAMHGRRFPKTERIESHPNCRCAMVPMIRDVVAIPESQTGEALFRRLPAREKRRILGAERYAAYRAGVALGDMVERTSSTVYGGGRRIVALSRLVGRRAA